MKHILYLDTNILNSYLSQIHDGLVKKQTQETGNKTETGNQNKESDPKAKGKVSIPGLVGLELEDSMVEQDSTFSSTQYGKELIEKIFHDNALDHVIKNLKNEGALKTALTDVNIGDYVYLSSEFDIFDIDQINSILGSKDILSLIKQNSPSTPGAERLKNSSLNEISRLARAVKLIVPCGEILIGRDFCAPIKQEFLRESLPAIAFKYTGNIKILGRITNKMENFANSKHISESPFNDMIDEFNAVIPSMLGIYNSWIITPIALFFE